MNYYIIDITFLIIILLLSYYFYKKNLYEKLFEYIKLFLLITLSAKFSSYMAYGLSHFNLIKADSYSVLVLIAFTLNFLLLFYSYGFLLQLSNVLINNKKLKEIFAKAITLIEVVILFTFSLYILMQISINKKYIQPTLKTSIIYSYSADFYKKFLDYDFVYMIISSDSHINHKEVIFKSIKNSL